VIAIDSSVLVDLIAGGARAEESTETVRDALHLGPVVVCDVVLAEICTAFKDGSEVLEQLEAVSITFSVTESKSALRAGEMQRRYRHRGGGRDRMVADFLIGAHALMQCNALITRDAGFFRDYFKGLKVIVPKAA
jgi:predicted nucleic acid-binding protein